MLGLSWKLQLGDSQTKDSTQITDHKQKKNSSNHRGAQPKLSKQQLLPLASKTGQTMTSLKIQA